MEHLRKQLAGQGLADPAPTPTSKAEMVALLLRTELASARFGDQLRA